ncbi:hypothetical protein RV06_GL000136 [Enterococcus haemoperoxidus]|nr:hypothetical protein RV06_GL000136 [Enterococcus haemoperoxidus]
MKQDNSETTLSSVVLYFSTSNHFVHCVSKQSGMNRLDLEQPK